MKVSPVVAAGLICLVLGAGIGALVATSLAPSRAPRGGSNANVGSMPAVSMGGGGGGAEKKSDGGAGKGGPRGPSAKNQLAMLVTKLDLLTGNTLTLTLADDQKKAVEEQVRGLDAATELPEEDAKKRLDALLATLASHKDTLVAAGFWWPGDSGFRPPADTPNPFTDEARAKSLKALQQRLTVEPAK